MKIFYKILISILILTLVFGVFFIFQKKSSKKAVSDYITTEIKRGKIVKEVAASGSINPVNVVKVSTQVSGTIEKIYVDYNDEVKKGEILAELDKSILNNQLDEAKAAIKKAEAKKDLASLDAVRKRNLFNKKYIAKSEIEQAEANLKIAIAEYREALLAYKKADINLGYAVIASPVSGVVISREVDAGQTVSASLQAPDLFLIAEDLKKMQIETSISEADVGFIKKGQKAFFTVDAYEYEKFEGAVKQIRLNPTVEQNVVTYSVIIEIDNKDLKLMPGMTAFVTILINAKNDIFKVSNRAFNVKMDDGAKEKLSPKEAVIYRLNADNHITPIKVAKGISNALETEVISPDIKEGDKIVEEIIKLGSKKNGADKQKISMRVR